MRALYAAEGREAAETLTGLAEDIRGEEEEKQYDAAETLTKLGRETSAAAKLARMKGRGLRGGFRIVPIDPGSAADRNYRVLYDFGAVAAPGPLTMQEAQQFVNAMAAAPGVPAPLGRQQSTIASEATRQTTPPRQRPAGPPQPPSAPRRRTMMSDAATVMAGPGGEAVAADVFDPQRAARRQRIRAATDRMNVGMADLVIDQVRRDLAVPGITAQRRRELLDQLAEAEEAKMRSEETDEEDEADDEGRKKPRGRGKPPKHLRGGMESDDDELAGLMGEMRLAPAAPKRPAAPVPPPRKIIRRPKVEGPQRPPLAGTKRKASQMTDPDDELEGGGAMPDRNLLQQMAEAAYNKTNPPTTLGNYTLQQWTPTLKFYKNNNDNTIIVAIRGTVPTDAGDLKADALIGVGQLGSSNRYQQDLQTLQQFQVRFPFSQYDYYGVGHSLGGAILDRFLRAGLLKSGISYNPAVEPGNFQARLPNQRIYREDDALYQMMGRNVPGVEVRKAPPKKRGFFENLAAKTSIGAKALAAKDYLSAHVLTNFVGGGWARDLQDARDTLDIMIAQGRPKKELDAQRVMIQALSREGRRRMNKGLRSHQKSEARVHPKPTLPEEMEGSGFWSPENIDKAKDAKRRLDELNKSPFEKQFGFNPTPFAKSLFGGAKPSGEFAKQLHETGLSPEAYLRKAQAKAKKAGLPHKLLGFADDDQHKLAIPDKDGRMVKFGAVGYGDHILWSDAEARGEVPKGYAAQKRRVFRKSHSAIKGDWKKDPFSPNSLALKVLW